MSLLQSWAGVLSLVTGRFLSRRERIQPRVPSLVVGRVLSVGRDRTHVAGRESILAAGRWSHRHTDLTLRLGLMTEISHEAVNIIHSSAHRLDMGRQRLQKKSQRADIHYRREQMCYRQVPFGIICVCSPWCGRIQDDIESKGGRKSKESHTLRDASIDHAHNYRAFSGFDHGFPHCL